jgi:hypothetical protein
VHELLTKGAAREMWSTQQAATARERLNLAHQLEDLAGCRLVIEAAPEDLGLKRDLFARLASICGPDAILATNTSSLSVTAIGGARIAPAASAACTSSTRRRSCGWSRSSPATTRLPRRSNRPRRWQSRCGASRSVRRTGSASWPTGSRARSRSRRCVCWASALRRSTRSTGSSASAAAFGWARSS